MSRNSGLIINETHALVTEDCINCGVVFAMPDSLNKRRQDDHKSFYCPNGHPMVYSGKTAAQKAQERAEWLSQQLASRDDDLRAERMAHSSTKGQLTKARKRAAAGVCPVETCHRAVSSARMAAHVKTCHPDFAPEAVQS